MTKKSIFKPASDGTNAHWMTMFLTTKCNLACEYCYNKGINEAELSLENAKKIVDWFQSQVFEEESGISFFGGELMLKFELMKEIVEYAKSKDPKITFSITTNGTLISEKHAKFFNDNFKFVGISIDGPKHVHDTHRKLPDGRGSFDLIDFNALKKIKNLYISSVVTPKTVYYLYDTIMFVKEVRKKYGFREQGFKFAYEMDWTERESEEYRSQLERLADYYVESFKREGPSFSFMTFDKFIGGILNEDNLPEYYCNAGRQTFAVAPSGDLYSCHWFCPGKLNCLGNVLGKVDIGPLEKNNYFMTEFGDKCRDCRAKCLCSRCMAVKNHLSWKDGFPERICRLFIATYDVMESIIERLKNEPGFNEKFGFNARH